jgi:hypothetical protein
MSHGGGSIEKVGVSAIARNAANDFLRRLDGLTLAGVATRNFGGAYEIRTPRTARYFTVVSQCNVQARRPALQCPCILPLKTSKRSRSSRSGCLLSFR